MMQHFISTNTNQTKDINVEFDPFLWFVTGYMHYHTNFEAKTNHSSSVAIICSPTHKIFLTYTNLGILNLSKNQSHLEWYQSNYCRLSLKIHREEWFSFAGWNSKENICWVVSIAINNILTYQTKDCHHKVLSCNSLWHHNLL